MTQLLYFAWVRERIGVAHEARDIPENVTNVTQLLNWLSGLGENYENAMQDMESLRVALDQSHVEHDALIGNAREIAIFPPMTGG